MRKISTAIKYTDFELRFIDSYVLHMDGPRAVKIAGGTHANAPSAARKLLEDPRIKKEVDRRIQDRQAEHRVTEQKIVDELAAIAFLDPIKIYNEDGSVKALEELPPEVRRAVIGVQTRVKGKGKNARAYLHYEIADKMRALEMLGKYLALFTDKIDIKNNQTRNMSDAELTSFIAQLAQQTGIGNIIDGEATEISSTEDNKLLS